jgi:hypothetical protein
MFEQNKPKLLNLLIDKKIDIALISKTYNTITTNNIFLGYNMYSRDHQLISMEDGSPF